MTPTQLTANPFNLILTGVGGQGNVMASRVLGDIFSRKGYTITIGETFGVSQRGGSVMSHLRISSGSTCSPQIPRGQAQLVVALEPSEALRVLSVYGNPDIQVLCNTRPIYAISVIAGDRRYPALEQIRRWVDELSARAWFIDATDQALLHLNHPVYGNIMLLGALQATAVLPFSRDEFKAAVTGMVPAEKVEVNLKAFDLGGAMVS